MQHQKRFRLAQLVRELPANHEDQVEGEAEEGFTLIELMVVLLIMAILLAIAIPTFLGVANGAKDRATQSNLSNAAISAKAFFVNNTSSYTGATATSLDSQEPELSFVAGAVTNANPNSVSFEIASDGQGILFAGQSADGRCWYAEDNEESSATAPAGLPTGASSAQGITYDGTVAGASTPPACDATATALPTAGTAAGDLETWGTPYPS